MHIAVIQCVFRVAFATACLSAAEAAESKLSPVQKAAVTSSVPRFQAPKPAATPAPAANPFSNFEASDPEILPLPKMVVEERKLKTADVLTLKGKADQFMKDYLGSKTGLDRGFFNQGVMNWRVGPGTFRLFGAMTNEDRALEARFDDLRLRQREDLLTTVKLLDVAGDPEKAAWLRRQSNDLFIRQPDVSRDGVRIPGKK